VIFVFNKARENIVANEGLLYLFVKRLWISTRLHAKASQQNVLSEHEIVCCSTDGENVYMWPFWAIFELVLPQDGVAVGSYNAETYSALSVDHSWELAGHNTALLGSGTPNMLPYVSTCNTNRLPYLWVKLNYKNVYNLSLWVASCCVMYI
jgi:hypothetical protein